MTITDPIAHFWSYVQKTETCWLWTGGLDKYGYGQVRWEGKTERAHRIAYRLVNGPIGRKELHHRETCPKRCVNPDHVEPTTRTNHPDRLSTINRNKTHCPAGHKYNYTDKRGSRYCLTCITNRRKYGNPHGPVKTTVQD